VAKDIKRGEVFTEENIRSVRPSFGLHPKYLKDILGQVATRDYSFGDRFE
jgi:pseudaminic acid synthase